MKKLYLLLILSLSLYVLSAQSPVYFEPSALAATVGINDSAVVHAVLHNATNDTVEFYFPGYTSKGQGGPDSYGYSWIDSEEPGGPDWSWTDISENGYLIEGLGDDLVAGPYELDIDFPFYGQTKNIFWVSSNGCISFNDQNIPFANGVIPTNNDFTDFIAWFWDDLTIDTSITKVYFKNFEEKTIVQFTKMVHYPGTESFITGQVIMMANGSILIKYRLVSENFETISATVGLQSWNPELGLQVAYNQEYVHSELAVRFDLHKNFITSVSPASLTLLPGTQETIWITYSSVGYESGSYEQELKCVTDKPEYPQIFLHNVMHVTNPNLAGFKGYVTSASTGLPIDDVKVIAGEQYVYTNSDGHYELPLEEGSYNVKFQREGYQTKIVEDTTAVAGYSILDVELEGFYFIAGRVFAGEDPIESGFAYGYKMIEETVVDIYAEMVGELGWYEFSGLSSAHYIVKAEPSPNSNYYGDFLPTYYGDVIHWEDATIIDLIQGTDDAHIHLVAVISSPQGPGSISGTIENENRAAGIPIVLRETDGLVTAMTYSSTDGSFSFSDLAYGTYEVFAEIPGKSIIPQTIILDEVHPSAEGIHMMIMESEIVFLGIAESEIFETIPFIYPNPVNDRINLNINLKKPSLVNIDVTDLSGRTINRESHNMAGQKSIFIDVKSLPKGLYLLRFEAMGEVILKKFIKE